MQHKKLTKTNMDINCISLINKSNDNEFIIETNINDDDCYLENDMESERNSNDFDKDTYSNIQSNSVLNEDILENSLHHLATVAEGTGVAFLHATISAMQLTDISLIVEYQNLQKIDVSHNELTNVESLSYLPHLMWLDVSHNKLETLEKLQLISKLQYLDASFNLLSDMGDFSKNILLKTLILNNNKIHDIQGLHSNNRLKHLSLSHNCIMEINNLKDLPISTLIIDHNKIKRLENLETLTKLLTLSLSSNILRSLEGLEKNELLSTLEVDNNEIIDLSEISRLKCLRLLRLLNLNRNPILQIPDYRLSIIFRLPFLTELDRSKVTLKERVIAENNFNPSMEIASAREHAMHVIYSVAQPQKILQSTLTNPRTPYPMLVLVGPHASGKHQMALRLSDELKDYFKMGLSHTTRKPRDDEEDGVDYHFVTLDEFEALIKQGRLLQTYSENGALYGLTIDAVEDVAKDGYACIVHMELEGVFTLTKTHFEPRLLLTMSSSINVHEKRMRDRGGYSEEMISNVLKRSKMYADFHRQHPGFFDLVICDDDLADAYRKLRRIVLDYLGVGGEDIQSETVSGFDRDFTWAETPLTATSGGNLEIESIKKRTDLAKAAARGFNNNILEFERAKTLPDFSEDNLKDTKDLLQRLQTRSAPVDNLDELPLSTPDSSDDDCDDEENKNVDESSFGESISDRLDSEESVRMPNNNQQNCSVDRLDFYSDSQHTMSGILMAPRPMSSDRPGSEAYPVLPPINSSRPPVPVL